MSTSAHLGLPFVQASQSQKHVTVNDAFERLDVLVEANVLDKDLGDPPASPATGDRYIVGPTASGDWAGREGEIATFDGTGWTFVAPKNGWKVWLADEAALYGFHSGGWNVLVSGEELTPAELKDGSVGHVGVNAAADDTNRLAVKSPAVLFDNAGADSRVKVSKAAAGDTASHLFQTNYSARAEFGLIGDDDFALKVSADGAAFSDVFKVANGTGALDFKVPPTVNGVPFENAVREGNVINAIDYGLSETATAAENTAALNAAADALRNAVVVISGDNRYTPVIFRIPPGTYNIAEKSAASKVGLDFSMIRLNGRVIMDCRGAVLVTDATLAGKVVLDLIGSRWFSGWLPAIHTPHDELVAPLTGIQFGRYNDSVSCDEMHFTDIQVRGYFTRACVHNLHAEVSVFENVCVFNFLNAATAYAWIQDGWSHWLPESDADTSGMTQDSGHSFLMNTFVGGTFRAAGTVGVAMHLGRTRQHVLKNAYFVSFGLTTVEVAREADGLRFEDCHFESVIDHCVRFTSIGGVTTFVADGLSFHEVRANARASIFGIEAGLATVELNDFDCSIHRFNWALTQGVFEDPAKVSILGGRVFLENLTYWQPLATFRGALETPGVTNLSGTRTYKSNVTFEDTARVQDDGFGRLQFLNAAYGGRVARMFATSSGSFLLRPTSAPGVDNAGRDFFYDPAAEMWKAEGDFAVDDNPVMHKGRGLSNQQITLADDTATPITPPAEAGLHFALVVSTNSANTGALLAHVSPSQNTSQIVTQVAGGLYEVLDGTALTGITGTDGKVTLGVSGGTVYLENRAGQSRTFSLSFLASR